MNKVLKRKSSKNTYEEGQNVYDVLDIESPQEMFIKARITASITTKLTQKGMTTENAAGRARITEKQLNEILSGGFHKITAFRLRRIMNLI